MADQTLLSPNKPVKSKSLKQSLFSATWTVILATSLVAGLTAIGIQQLNVRVDKSTQISLLLTRMKEQLSRLNSLEWEAIAQTEIDDDLEEELIEYREDTTGLIAGLKSLDPQNAQLGVLISLYQAYESEVDSTLNLVEQGTSDAEIATKVFEIDDVYDELYAEISAQEDHYSVRKEQTQLWATLGTNLSIVLAAVIINTLIYEFSKSLTAKNKALSVSYQNLQKAQDQLVQSEKMAALGQLVAGIAHEINNPLGAIQASADNTDEALKSAYAKLTHLDEYLDTEQKGLFFQLLQESLKVEVLNNSTRDNRIQKRKLMKELSANGVEEARSLADLLVDMGAHENIEGFMPLIQSDSGEWAVQLAYHLHCASTNSQIIRTSVDRASKTVFALKNYARFDYLDQMQRVHLIDGIETVIQIYYSRLKHNITLVRNFQPVPEFWGYPDQLIQVWSNLIHNAIQAMDERGTLTISTAQENDGVTVTITDTGSGIPSDVQAKIFDAFFTTKAMGEGSGLGLHITKKVLDQHRGHIDFQSRPGHTEFRVWLPLQETSFSTGESR